MWAVREGDTGAFAALLACHQPPPLALCRRMLGDPTLAEDAAQEVSLQALLSLDRLQSGERFGAWLAGIGLNVCRMRLRARAHECWSWDALHRALELREAYHDAGARAEAADLIARVYAAVADVHGRDDPQAHATTWAGDKGVQYLQWQASLLAVPFYERLGYTGDPCPQPDCPFFEIEFPVVSR